MATIYTVHFTDPNTTPFTVNTYTVDGVAFPTKPEPNLETGATDAHTSFVVYGKGSANYGERLQENIIHLLENFSGSTAPVRPISGQLWFERRTFMHTGSSGSTTDWYEWEDSPGGSPEDGVWVSRSVTTTATSPPATAPVASKTFRLHVASNTLYEGIVISGHPLDGQWIVREFVEDALYGGGNPTLVKPVKLLKVYDGTVWKYVSGVFTATEEPTSNNRVVGTLWYDTTAPSSPILKIWNGAAWDGLPAGSIQNLADLGITVSEIEINQLAGVTSNVQVQLDSKLALAGGTMSGNINMNSVAKVTNLATPTVGGDATNKTYVDGNDIVSGSYNPGAGTLTLTKGNATTLTIPGFSVGGGSTGYTPQNDELLGALNTPPTTTNEAIRSSDLIAQRLATFRRKVSTGHTGTALTVPSYVVESNKLFIFVDGVKYYANSRGYQRVMFTASIGSPPTSPDFLDDTTASGLDVSGSPAPIYSCRVTVDGGGTQTINIDTNTTDVSAMVEVVNEINIQLTGAWAALEEDAIVIYSDSDGAGSSISIADGDGLGSPDFLLFGNMLYYSSIEAAVPGVTYGYSEDGNFGTTSTSITFTSALSAPNVVEAIVCGGTGLPL